MHATGQASTALGGHATRASGLSRGRGGGEHALPPSSRPRPTKSSRRRDGSATASAWHAAHVGSNAGRRRNDDGRVTHNDEPRPSALGRGGTQGSNTKGRPRAAHDHTKNGKRWPTARNEVQGDGEKPEMPPPPVASPVYAVGEGGAPATKKNDGAAAPRAGRPLSGRCAGTAGDRWRSTRNRSSGARPALGGSSGPDDWEHTSPGGTAGGARGGPAPVNIQS